jgi:7-cyano-7-deazaguanine reductase
MRESKSKRGPSKKGKTFAGLTLLGRSEAGYPDAPDARVLEVFPNRFPARDYVIRFRSAEFTSMCPVTGQPDFAEIEIEYIPEACCVESKSLKFYLAAFRNTRSFNEEIVNRILDDLVAACAPRWAVVRGVFAARGGVQLSVEAEHLPGEI